MKKLLVALVVGLLVVGPLSPTLIEARGTFSARGEPLVAPGLALTRDLVQRAQLQLREAGFNPGPVDGNWGPQTEAALREYQRAYRLPVTGGLDEATIRSLMPEEAQGVARWPAASSRDLIQRAQARLKVIGFNPGRVDGNWGPQTEAALREYQRAYRLPVTGALDEATVRSLMPEEAQTAFRPIPERDLIRDAQARLRALGFNPGLVDGNWGRQTEAALREYQRAYRLPMTGMLDEGTVRSLMPERSASR